MAGLTYKQISAIVSVNTVALAGMTVGSFLLASVLAGPVDGGIAPSNISDGTNTWVPLTTENSVNAMSFFYCASNSLASGTFTAVGATGTIRFWVTELTGQHGTPIAAVLPVSLSSPSAGPLSKLWTNLTSIYSVWHNPGTSAATNVDGGVGTVISGAGNGAPVVLMNNTLQGPGSYTMTWTQSPFATANGMIVLVKSSTSVLIDVSKTYTVDANVVSPSIISLSHGVDSCALVNVSRGYSVDAYGIGFPTLYFTELYHDNFNRPNENPLDPKNWLERPVVPLDGDVLQLLSGVCCSTIAYPQGGDGTAQYKPPLPPDQYAECVLGDMDIAGFDFGTGLIGVLNLYIRDSSTQSFMVPFWTVGIANGIDGTGYMDYWQGANFGSGPVLPFDAAVFLNAPVGSMGPSFTKERWLPGDKLSIAVIGDYATGSVYISKNGVVIHGIRQNASTFSIQTGKAGLQIFQWSANRPSALSITRWAVGAASLDPFRRDIGVDAYIRVPSVTSPIIETVDFEPKIGKVRYF